MHYAPVSGSIGPVSVAQSCLKQISSGSFQRGSYGTFSNGIGRGNIISTYLMPDLHSSHSCYNLGGIITVEDSNFLQVMDEVLPLRG